jgi:hypothetical protein
MSAEEFFKEADEAATEDSEKTDDADTNECDVSEGDVIKMSPEEFFDINEDDAEDVEKNEYDVSEAEKEEKEIAENSSNEEAKVDEEELMTAEEFFKEAECPKCKKDPCECPVDETTEDSSEKEENIDETDTDDEKLEESLKEYRKNNAHLFNG